MKHYDVDILGFGDLVSKNPYSVLPAILFYGHYHDAVRKGHPVNLTIHDVEDWMEEIEDPLNDPNMVSATQRCIESIVKYLPKSKEVEAVEEGEKKN